MNLRQLRYFVAVVDAGSFSRAAPQIAHVAQPALSLQISELEQSPGVMLPQRSSRGVSATAAGERIYVEANAILRRVERLHEIALGNGQEVEGRVCVGMSSTLAGRFGGLSAASAAGATGPTTRAERGVPFSLARDCQSSFSAK